MRIVNVFDEEKEIDPDDIEMEVDFELVIWGKKSDIKDVVSFVFDNKGHFYYSYNYGVKTYCASIKWSDVETDSFIKDLTYYIKKNEVTAKLTCSAKDKRSVDVWVKGHSIKKAIQESLLKVIDIDINKTDNILDTFWWEIATTCTDIRDENKDKEFDDFPF